VIDADASFSRMPQEHGIKVGGPEDPVGLDLGVVAKKNVTL